MLAPDKVREELDSFMRRRLRLQHPELDEEELEEETLAPKQRAAAMLAAPVATYQPMPAPEINLEGLKGSGGGGGKGALAWLIGKESSGRTDADNPTSTAFGLGQLLEDNREKYAAKIGVSPDTKNRQAQLTMMRMYIQDRYGNARKAKRFHQQHGWY